MMKDNKNETPFERMKRYLESAGYKLDRHYGANGANGYGYRDAIVEDDADEDIVFYFGMPTGEEWYWQLDGKIAAAHSSVFNKWSQTPLVAWLPETDGDAEKIMRAIEFLKTPRGIEMSNQFEAVNEMFDIEYPKREP